MTANPEANSKMCHPFELYKVACQHTFTNREERCCQASGDGVGKISAPCIIGISFIKKEAAGLVLTHIFWRAENHM